MGSLGVVFLSCDGDAADRSPQAQPTQQDREQPGDDSEDVPPGDADEPEKESLDDSEDAGEYTCVMHPDVSESTPGDCPVCAMELVAAEDIHETEESAEYTCPMHPEVREPEMGSCPICRMDLVSARQVLIGELARQMEGDGLYVCPVHQGFEFGTGGDCPICEEELVELEPEDDGTGSEETVDDVPAEGREFDPPIEPQQLPGDQELWYCDMGIVEWAQGQEGDGQCPVCGMNLTHLPRYEYDDQSEQNHDQDHEDHDHEQ